MKIAIHQPNYLPWLGYFYKLAISDCFVLLDNAQFTRSGYQNRVKLKTPQGAQWLTQPVRLSDGSFKKTSEIEFADVHWRDKHIKTIIANYSRAKHFTVYAPPLFEELNASHGSLAEVNGRLIRVLAEMLGLKTRIINDSQLGTDETGTQRLVAIVKRLNGSSYVYGSGGVNYQDNSIFTENGIGLIPAQFTHPTYQQCWGDFIGGMSVVDLLFNYGPDSKNIIMAASPVPKDQL